MKIIGHRGARGVALENSLASIRTALALPVDAIEFDIHRTVDDVLVVMHDATTARVADQDVRINRTTHSELRRLKLKNNQQIPLLEEVLQLVGEHAVYIDIKDTGCADLLVALLRKYPHVRASFVSFHGSELKRLRHLIPTAATYLYIMKKQQIIPRPLKMVRAAQNVHASGIAIDKLYMNPVTYWAARKAGLAMYIYSVNTLSFAKLLHRLYPRLDICTSHPEVVGAYYAGVRSGA